ncbi:solute carrier organic anion transporter family member 2B1-like [Tubulanus polymorphus]|uniref:solute carrier organic anion transporter family member 2B1-like n=1 Tax=Tubulanus polymorphus TaxID=672921 RepID=UPI003DA46297
MAGGKLSDMLRCSNKTTINLFTLCLSLFAVSYGMILTYLVSQITTIEKRFGFTSRDSGWIVSSYEIGFLMAILFVSHFAPRFHRPRFIGSGALVIGTAGIVFAMPHFLFNHTDYNLSRNLDVSTVSNITDNHISLDSSCFSKPNGENDTCSSSEGGRSNLNAFIIFVISIVIAGTGPTTIWSIGMAYIDDNVEPAKSSLYLGFMMCLRYVAPILGFLLGASTATIHVDLEKSPNTSPESADWIGAWWLGFIICGSLTILCSVPLMLFRTSMAMTSAIGVAVSGVLTSKIPLSLSQKTFSALCIMVFCTAIFPTLMLFGCPSQVLDEFRLSISASRTNLSCSTCKCKWDDFDPVCAEKGGELFLSPCHAGCKQMTFTSTKQISYFNCTCAIDRSGPVAANFCNRTCQMFTGYIVILFVVSFLDSLIQMPWVMLSVRSVDKRDKSLALGLIAFLVSLTTLPVPIVYGNLIDNSCVLRITSCASGGVRNACKLYDQDRFRYSLHFLTWSIRLIVPVLQFYGWYKARNMKFPTDETHDVASVAADAEVDSEITCLSKSNSRNEYVSRDDGDTTVSNA